MGATLSFLTTVPLGRRHDAADIAPALFPVVGALLGAALAGLDLALEPVIPVEPRSALVIAALVVLTGGLHLDGLADSADSMLAPVSRERRLAILDDPHNGAFGFIAVATLLLLQWAALVSLDDWLRVGILLLFPAAARLAVLPLYLLPRAKTTGLAATSRVAFSAGAALVVSVLVFAYSGALFFPGGLLLPVAAAFGALVPALLALRRLGGVSGDVMGAGIEFAQAAVLLAAATSVSNEWLT